MQKDGCGTQWTKTPPAGARHFDHTQMQTVLLDPPDDKFWLTFPDTRTVEFWLVGADKLLLMPKGRRLACAKLKFDARHFPDHAQVPSWQTVGVGIAVVIQPLFKVFGFADVENPVRRIAHQVNPGAPRCLEKKLSAQPLVKRARIGQ